MKEKLKKEIEENTRRLKDLPCSWIGRINVVKLAKLSKAIKNAISMKIPTQFFTDMERAILNFIWKNKKKKSRILKTILNNRRSSVGITIPDLMLYLQLNYL